MADEMYELATPFWIDTEAYTDRDRDMFVCGYEFHLVLSAIERGVGWDQAIHTENESRVRMLCGRMKIPCSMKGSAAEGWTCLKIPKTKRRKR